MKVSSRCCRLLALGVILALGTGTSRAVELERWSEGGEPIQIDSESLEARPDDGLVVFRGEVVARQGEMTLQTEELRVYADVASSEIHKVEARGSVRIRRQDLVATGQQADFDVAAGVLTLSGEARAWQGRNVVTGRRIVLYLADNRMVVDGAKGIIYPGEQQLPQ